MSNKLSGTLALFYAIGQHDAGVNVDAGQFAEFWQHLPARHAHDVAEAFEDYVNLTLTGGAS